MNEKESVCKQLIEYTDERIILSFRFLGGILSKVDERLSDSEATGIKDGVFVYNIKRLMEEFRLDQNIILRKILHMLMHYLFCHDISNSKEDDANIAGIAYDIVVENVINELIDEKMGLLEDTLRQDVLDRLRKQNVVFSPRNIIKHINESYTDEEILEIAQIFKFDSHENWNYSDDRNKIQARKEEIQKVKTDLETFSKAKAGNAMMLALKEATRNRVDYKAFLRSFAYPVENVKMNDDEYDMIYYTYGKLLYDNVLLVEPTEYVEDNKIQEFVIVIDTSGSTAGKPLMNFINQTYSILHETESFDSKLEVHIIECDDEVRRDIVINSSDDIEKYVKKLSVSGFGGTDFSKAFEYVDELIKNGDIKNLKGLIYFTDLRGRFPSMAPSYKTVFIYTDDMSDDLPVPSWAYKVRFESEV